MHIYDIYIYMIYIYIYIHMYICTYIHIYIFKQMPIFYVLLKYMIKKHMIYVKVPIFLFYSEVLSMWNQITNKNSNKSATA